MAEKDKETIVSLDNLNRYNDKLIGQMGLKKDTAEYEIADATVPTKSGSSYTNVSTNVKGAVDQLFKLSAGNTVTAGEGITIAKVIDPMTGDQTSTQISSDCESETWSESDFPFDTVES